MSERMWEKKVQSLNVVEEEKEVKKKEIEETINDFINLVINAKTPSIKSRYEAKVEELDKEYQALCSNLENKKLPEIKEALDMVFRFIATPAETWKKASPEGKNVLHNMIFVKNPEYCLSTGFATPELSLPFRIKEHIFDSDGLMVEGPCKTWNTFLEIALEWAPVLRDIYEKNDNIVP